MLNAILMTRYIWESSYGIFWRMTALQKVYFLYMAGYKHEVVATALQAGKRLVIHYISSLRLMHFVMTYYALISTAV